MKEAVIGAAGRVANEGERSAEFRVLAERYLDRSYGLARAILGDSSEAEDAVQDACLAAWRGWGNLRDVALFERWFQRILINTCRDRLRERSRRRTIDVSADLASEGGDAYASIHVKDALDTAIARLPPEDQVLLGLRYYRDLKVEDVAGLLSIPPGTVMSRLHHAVRRLRAVLDETGGREGLR